ncbi:MAG TPA: cupin domain-containing protein [Vicinamibacteria bacterium]
MSTLLRSEEVGRRVRVRRLAVHLSVRGLAAATDFSPSFISQVEHGQVSPSIGSLQKLAEALGVTLGQFFEADAGAFGLVVKKKDRVRLESAWSHAGLEALLKHRPGRRLEAVLVTLRRGGRSGKRAHAPAHEELVYVLKGNVRLELKGNVERLGSGDAVSLPEGEPRLFVNPGPGRAELLLVSSRS